MSFGGFSGKSRSGFRNPNGGGVMGADDLCFYNLISTRAKSQPREMVLSSHFQPLFNSPPLSLALSKMENLGEMGWTGESYDSGLIGKTRADEFESRSGSDNLEAASEDDQNTTETRSSKRKKYHRHTALQIQELEASFKENPHPDEKQRSDLGRRLGLEGKQVKFWFQNRRTQMKTQLDRHENSILKQENDKLRIENIAMKEAMRNPICDKCGSRGILGEVPTDQHHLKIENARLKEELNRLGILVSKFLSEPNSSMPPPIACNSKLDLAVGRNSFGLNSMDPLLPSGLDFGNRVSNSSLVMPPNGPAISMMSVEAPLDKTLFLELALAAMDELIKLAQIDSPLWSKSLEGSGESLNIEEYTKTISPCIGVKPSHFVTDATRATGTIFINSMGLVDTLMDVNQWIEMFPWNIGKALTFDVISPGLAGNKNGALQLMQAEFQVLSPMVPVRQLKFLRFCKQHGENLWAVVDVSVDAIFHGTRGSAATNCRRLPSGCIVQDMLNGYSKVTWIEHIEYDENIIHQLYRPLLRSGMAFGAQKWVANLRTQCELFASIMPSVASNGGYSVPPNGKKSIIKLAQRMTRSFCTGVCATVHKWEVIEHADNTKLMMRKSLGNSGMPPGVILSATTTVWIPVPPLHLLDYLQNEKTRGHWDVLSQDGPMQQMFRMPKGGQDLGNSICLFRTSVPDSNTNPDQSNLVILQHTSIDASGSLIVYAAVETVGMNMVMSGGDSSSVAILPSGFAIVPDCFPNSSQPNKSNEGQLGGGSLLTIGFQILVNNLPTGKLTMESIETVKSLISRTLQGIKGGLHGN